MSVIIKLIGMVILGLLSAVLTHHKKNYYVRTFDDILGKEPDPSETNRLGRGFVYGFFFPVYFVLFIVGLVSLVVFLIIGAICGAIAFVLIYLTEKIIPTLWLGGLVESLLTKMGIISAPKPETGFNAPSYNWNASQGDQTQSACCGGDSASCCSSPTHKLD
jgi:hypothetical protein